MTSKEPWATPDALSHLIAFGYKLTEALDDEQSPRIQVTEAEQSLREGTVFPLLDERIGRSVDLTIFDQHARQTLTAALVDRAGADQDERQYNIDRNGVCTLLALTFSAIGYVNAKIR